MKEKELKELKLTKNIIIPFPNFQQNTIISPTQMNDNFEEIEYAYNNLIDNHNGAITKINEALAEITSTDNEAISNEQARVQAEEIRVQNEEQRINDENERRAEETKRIAMYNTHMNDETKRQQAHREMVSAFNSKVSEVDNAINAIPSKEELKGERGEKGDKGDKGDKGEPGDITNIDLSHIENQLDNKPNYVVANSFEGSNGGEKIQNALNSSYSGNGIKIVVVDSKCGNEDMWLITSPLKIPSNTCLLLNGCYLKLANGVNNAIINNSDFDNGNKNVHIIGVGNPVLDCNRNGQNSLLNNYKNIGLHLYNVDGFSIKGVTLKDCTKWSLVPERCKNGFIEDIVFDNKGYVNQDGVHIIGPSTKITCAKIRGVVGDDACVINARTSGGGTGTFQGYGTGGDVTDILFSDVNIEGGIESHTGILRTSASPTTKVDNIMLVNAIGHNLTDALIRVGGNDTTNADLHGGITVNNVTGHAKDGQGIRLVRFLQNASNVKITNAKVYSESKSSIVDTANVTVKNLTIDNIDYTISENNTVLTNGLSAFRLRTSTIINFEANNIRHIDNVGAIDYSNSLIITGSGSTLDNIHINGFTGLNITGLIDTTKVASLGKVRLDNYKINDVGFTANSYNNNINNVITNGLVKMTGSTPTPQESICNIGDVIRYKASGSSKYINYIKLAPNTYKEIAEVDLSNYYTSAQTDSKIAQEIAKAQLGGGNTSSGGSGGVSNNILAKYVHVGNQEIYLADFDISTGVFTCNAPHNLTKNTPVIPRLKTDGKFQNIPKECLLSSGELTLVPQTSTTFTLNGITFNETNNDNVDVSKFYFECFKNQRLILDFKEEVKSINVRIYGTTGNGDLYTCAYYDGFFDIAMNSAGGGSTYYRGATAMSANAIHFNPRYFNIFFNMSIVDNLIVTNGTTAQIGFNTNRAITSKSIAQIANVVEFFRNSFTGLCIGSTVHNWCLTNGLTIIIEKCGE